MDISGLNFISEGEEDPRSAAVTPAAMNQCEGNLGFRGVRVAQYGISRLSLSQFLYDL